MRRARLYASVGLAVPSWDISVRFHDGQGLPRVVEESTFDAGLVSRAQSGRMDIEYDPEDPTLNRLKGGAASLFGYFRPSGLTIRDRVVLRVAYTFLVDQRTHRGTTTTVAPAPPGASIWVLYDPRDPERSVAASPD